MSMPFERWTDRITAARDEAARRRLLAEIGQWRASRLSDIPSMREAASAMSRLYALLGEGDAALREATSLLSLCQTPPLASREELQAAKAYLEALGGKGVLSGPAERAANQKGNRKKKGGAADPARAALEAGQWDEALVLLETARGDRAELMRTLVLLARARARDSEERRDVELAALEARLRSVLLARPEPKPARKQEAVRSGHPLEALVGGPVPHKWKARLKVLERFIDDNPERIDELAALALDHHVVVSGDKAPAPWLIGIVGRALAMADGDRVRSAIESLRSKDAFLVTAYEEWPFGALVAVLRRALAEGWTLVALRRGVIARGEPRDRKLWTLRLEKDGVERMVVVGAPQDEPYEDEMVGKLAERLPYLCPVCLLIADGPGNAGLREAAIARGVAVLDTGEPEAVLEALAVVEPIELPESERKPRESRDAEPRSSEPRRPEAPRVAPKQDDRDVALATLRRMLTAEEPPSVEALAEAVEALPRVRHALALVPEVLADGGRDDRGARVVALLRAAHEVAPDKARLPEGITLAVDLAAASDNGGEALALLTEGPAAARYGGPGVHGVVEVARALRGGGWSIDRVMRGPTLRERREKPALRELDDSRDGLWRLRASRGGARGELWFLTDLSDQARAAFPAFLDDAGATAVVLPATDDGAWLGDVEAITWNDGAAETLLQKVEAWQ